jgi:hypothetical protein
LVCLAGLGFPPVIRAGGLEADLGSGTAWSFYTAAGYDTYIHTFPLADEDTTETISEWMVAFGTEGRASPSSRHRWRLRPEFSYGSELLRERVDFDYRYRRPDGLTALRLDARWQARQYRGATDYRLSSDHHEGRLEARWLLAPPARVTPELRAFGGYRYYQNPSTFEIGHGETGGAVFLRSGQQADQRFQIGARLTRRSYPDSAAINRTIVAGEGEFDAYSWSGAGVRAYHRSEHRDVQDEQARPSAWTHWSELDWNLPLGRIWLLGEFRSEIWEYQTDSEVYFDSWRLRGALMLRIGDITDLNWRLGMAGERLAAPADSPEAYRQYGVRAGLEGFGRPFSGSVLVEHGLRDYSFESGDMSAQNSLVASNLVDTSLLYTYSDFRYWEIWIMGTWSLTRHLSLDVMANYQPESHTERADDSAIGFGNVRLQYRW